MKKAVITILGIQGGFVANGQVKFSNSDHRAKYYFDGSSKKEEYFNTLPLLINNYDTEYKIVPIYTKEAKIFNEAVMKLFYPHLTVVFDSKYLIKDEKNFKEIFSLFNRTIEEFDEVIIDVTHGFRHLPLLMLIDLMIINFKDINKVSKILFAKEIDKHTPKQVGLYEIIDLKDYLDLANFSLLLSSFNQNYTVSSNISFKNRLYRELAQELSEFSHHFLSNSLKPLIEGDLIENIIDNLEELQKDKSVEHFKHYIEDIIYHLEDIRQLKYELEWKKLYKISKIMDKRGYQLNAITLLFEAVGFYCLESLSNLDSVGKRAKEYYGYIEQGRKPKHIYSSYTMTNQIRTVIKIDNRFHISNEQLFISNETIKNEIIDYIEDVNGILKFKNFLQDLEALRNNLAHGNSSDSLGDVKKSYKSHLRKFKDLCIDKDIFSTAKNFNSMSPIDRLNSKFN